MTTKKNIKPTDGELEILQVLWEMGECTVRQVNEELNKKRDVGYTTTLKIMQIMLDKQLLRRDTSTRTHIYRVAVSEDKTQKQLLKDFLKTTFRGSAMSLVLQALGDHDASEDELDKIKALIEQKEKE